MEGPLTAGFAAIIAIAGLACVAAWRTNWRAWRIVAVSALPGATFGTLVAAGSGGSATGLVLIATTASAVAGALGTYAGRIRRSIKGM
ncbi:hypothetical protein [Sphingomonas sp.]